MALRHVRQYPDPVLRRPDRRHHRVRRRARRPRRAHVEHHGRRPRHRPGRAAAGPAPAPVHLPARGRPGRGRRQPDGHVVQRRDRRSTRRAASRSATRCACRSAVRSPIKVEAQTAAGEPRTWEFGLDDYYARVFQHEIDHLDGVLMIDRTEDDEARVACDGAPAPAALGHGAAMALAFAGTAPFGAAILRGLLDGPGRRSSRARGGARHLPAGPSCRARQAAREPAGRGAREGAGRCASSSPSACTSPSCWSSTPSSGSTRSSWQPSGRWCASRC